MKKLADAVRFEYSVDFRHASRSLTVVLNGKGRGVSAAAGAALKENLLFAPASPAHDHRGKCTEPPSKERPAQLLTRCASFAWPCRPHCPLGDLLRVLVESTSSAESREQPSGGSVRAQLPVSVSRTAPDPQPGLYTRTRCATCRPLSPLRQTPLPSVTKAILEMSAQLRQRHKIRLGGG